MTNSGEYVSPTRAGTDDMWKLGGGDTLLLLLAAPDIYNQGAGIRGITKLTKLMFLAREEAGFGGDENFDFEPYKYGPFSRQLYSELRALKDAGLINIFQSSAPDYFASEELSGIEDQEVVDAYRALSDGPTSPPKLWVFQLTPRGRRMAQQLRKRLPDDRWAKLVEVKRHYDRLSLGELLSYVYQKYPAWGANSIHPLARRSG